PSPHPPPSPPFPYTTLFRSADCCRDRLRPSRSPESLPESRSAHRRTDPAPPSARSPSARSSVCPLLGKTRLADGNRNRSAAWRRSEEHTSELQSRVDLVCRL